MGAQERDQLRLAEFGLAERLVLRQHQEEARRRDAREGERDGQFVVIDYAVEIGREVRDAQAVVEERERGEPMERHARAEIALQLSDQRFARGAGDAGVELAGEAVQPGDDLVLRQRPIRGHVGPLSMK